MHHTVWGVKCYHVGQARECTVHLSFKTLRLIVTLFSYVAGWKEILNTSAGLLQQGGVIGVPTDTIYGIACLAQSSQSMSNIYNLKGRNGTKPLAICVGDVEDIYRLVNAYCY